jgi:hypothetical protein
MRSGRWISSEQRRSRNRAVVLELRERAGLFNGIRPIEIQDEFDPVSRVRFDRELAMEAFELHRIQEALDELKGDPEFEDAVIIGTVEVFIRSYMNLMSRLKEAQMREPENYETLCRVVYERRDVLVRLAGMAEREMQKLQSRRDMKIINGDPKPEGDGHG